MGAKPKPEAAEASDRLLSPQPVQRTHARLAADGDSANESPARRLQEQLEWSLLDAADTNRWSHRRTAAFVIVTCGSFWIAAALLVRLTARALG